MRMKDDKEWLLCDFHIHTNMSDGKLSLRKIVNLYGEQGVDVISITDHTLDKYTLSSRLKNNEPVNAIKKEDFKNYLKILWEEQGRAWKEYRMLLIPGVEITNDKDYYHILAIGIKEYIDPSLSVEEIIENIKEQNAVSIAAHPDMKEEDKVHTSWYLCVNREKFRDKFDAWEVANRDDLFNSIGVKKYNYVANSDFHEPWHLYSWKTLIKAEKNVEAIKEAIKDNKDIAIYLMRKR